jgi:hypothetical protein
MKEMYFNTMLSCSSDDKSELGMEELMAEAYTLRAIHEKVCNYQILDSWYHIVLNVSALAGCS